MKKKILLVHPPFNDLKFGEEWIGLDSLAAPLGLMYIAEPLIEEGYDVRFIDFNVDKINKMDFIEELKKTDFLLLSCYSESLKNVLKIIKIAKDTNKNIYIMCGGPYCRLTGNYVKGSDLTLIGEGEEIITEIFKRICNGKSLSDIPGLIYLSNGRLIKNRGYIQAKSIDRNLKHSYDLTKNKNYGILFGYKIDGLVGTMTSRGCPYNCSFCTHKGSYQIKIVRKRSVDNIISELKYLEKRGAKIVVFYDDNFLIDKKRVMEIMDRKIKEKINLKLIVQGRVDSADIEFYRKLYAADVLMIIFGIENANQDVLDFYNKGITIEQTKKAIELANKAGMLTFGFFIIGSPIEETKHFIINKDFMNSVPLDFIHISLLSYQEGSSLWNNAVESGKISKKETRVLVNEKLSKYTHEEWVKMKGELLKEFYSRPSKTLRAFYKITKQGYMIEFLKIFLVGKNNFSKKIKNPYYIEKPDISINISENK